MNITQQKLDTMKAALNEINGLVITKQYSTARYNEIVKRHKLNMFVMSYAVKTNFFKRVDRGVYKSLFPKAEPIHARRIWEEIFEATNRENKRRKTELIGLKQTKKPTAKIDRKDAAEKTQPKSKSFSLFWGLFKFNY